MTFSNALRSTSASPLTHSASCDLHLHQASPGVRFDGHIRGDRAQQLGHIHPRLLELVHGALETHELEGTGDELLQAVRLKGRTRHVALAGAGVATRERQGELQPRKRRAQFVRYVAQQLLLALQQLPQPLGHGVQIGREEAQIVLSSF